MHYFVLLIIMFGYTENLSAQAINYPVKNDSSIVRIKEYYKGCGKVFSENKSNVVLSLKSKRTFKPSADDLILAEQLMTEKYADLIKSDERAKSLVGTEYKQHYY